LENKLEELRKKIEIAGILAETGRIYSSIQAAVKGVKHPVIVVSSAVAGEGKSLFAASLAISAVRNREAPVLLVDGNWYAPCQAAIFGVESAFKIETREQNVSPEIVDTGYPKLALLPAPECPLDLDPTSLIQGFIRQLYPCYSLTIVDAPAILSINRNMVDPIALAAAADGLALTVLANSTPRQMVKKAQTMCEVSGARVLGLVINQFCNPLAS
jgi:Mrp family chromosome partitioning ATPase